MAYLTFLGATAGSPTEIDMKVAPPRSLEPGKEVAAQSGLPRLPQDRRERQRRPRPRADQIGQRLPREAIIRSLQIGPGIMPSYQGLPPKKLNELADFLASLN